MTTARKAAATIEAVREIVAECYAARRPVAPLGGRTHRERGRLAPEPELNLDLRGLSGIVEYEPDDMTITVRAGTTIAELAETLRARRQTAGIEVAEPERGTVGGAVAINAWGPHLATLGRLRERVIGIQTVDGRGTVLRAGGRVVKNVSGYDLCKLYVGSLGTLGVITEVTFKLWPVAEREVAVAGETDSLDAWLNMRLPFGAWLTLHHQGDTWQGWLRAATTASAAASVESRLLAALSLSASTPRPIETEEMEALDGASWCLDATAIVVEIGYLPRFTRVVASSLAAADRVWMWPVAGAARAVLPTVEAVGSARSAIEAVGGRLIAISGHAELDLDPWGTPPAAFRLHAAIKEAFDPARILNRGRFWGGL